MTNSIQTQNKPFFSIPGELLLLRSSGIKGFTSIESMNRLLTQINQQLTQLQFPPLNEKNFHHKTQANTPEDKERFEKTQAFVRYFMPLFRDAKTDQVQFCKALLYIEIKNPSELIKPQNIEHTIKTINFILFPQNGGRYKTDVDSIIFHYDLIGSQADQEAFNKIDAYYEKSLDLNLKRQWKTSTREKVLNGFFKSLQGYEFDVNDLACIQKTADIIPSKGVADEMSKLETLVTSPLNCYEKAAKIHQLIVKTHPFPDGNGRTARLAMNLVLLAEGKPALLIENTEDYIKAIKGDHFANTIKNQSAKQPKCDPVVSLALRHIVFMTALKEFYHWN